MKRKQWIAVGAGAGLVAVGAWVVGSAAQEPTAEATETAAATATVTRQTLTAAQIRTGQVGYGDSAALAARRSGTVTWLAPAGSTVATGGALYRIDEEPVVLLTGTVPAFRNLEQGSSGADVEQLEQSLAALGYTGFTVDREYTAGTAAAVERWQEASGQDVTGTVRLGSVEFRAGPARVTAQAADTGSVVAPGTPVLQVSGTDRSVTVTLDSGDRDLASAGEPVTLDIRAGATGTVSQVQALTAQTQEGSSTTYTVTVAVDSDATAALPEGAAVDVSFDSETASDVLTVPVTALLALAEGGFGVERVVDGARSVVPVDVGLFAQGRVEVTGELAEGDVVVVAS